MIKKIAVALPLIAAIVAILAEAEQPALEGASQSQDADESGGPKKRNPIVDRTGGKAEAETANANQQFVSARQQVEQHGSQAVLDVVCAIEAAVNSGDLDGAVRLRHNELVPAIRAASA